jgi:predicted TIM-barrel fold metal-dependent hydrolase
VIIDALTGAIPLPDAFAAADGTLGRLRGYLEHFGGASTPRTYDETQAAVVIATEEARTRCPSEEEFFSMLDSGGIDVSVLYTEKYAMRLGVKTATNDEVSAFVARRPDRLLGVAGIDPWEDDAANEVDRAVNELGLRGVIMSPFKQGLEPGSARMARVLGRCEALGVPVLFHTGINWFKEAAYDAGHPRFLDAAASAFPDLKIVALHAGWPWVNDMMMIAWKHPNVYLDISAHRPRHFTVPESGWGALLYYGNRMLSHKVLFASTWTLLGVPPADLVKEVQALPLKDEVLERWLGLNAARVFGLD